jgi:hypothetical protein
MAKNIRQKFIFEIRRQKKEDLPFHLNVYVNEF